MLKPLAKLVARLTPTRTWFQFRLRTLLLLVVAVAVPCGWLKWKLDAKRRERAAVEMVFRHGGGVLREDGVRGPEWICNLFGEDIFWSDVTLVIIENGDSLTDADLRHFTAFPQLRELRLRDGSVGVIGIAELQKALPNCVIRTF
jgi:hypothetical protein